MRRPDKQGATEVAASLVGGAFVLFVLALGMGGSVYKTECTTETGIHTEGWDMPFISLPYLWDAGRGCQEHNLTRVVLGEVGLMGEVR